jgi:uncharacterized protein YggE
VRRSFALIACGFLLAAPAAAQTSSAPSDPPYIETVGTGQRRVAPDRANVHLIIETRAPTAAGAAAQNTRAVTAVVDTLRRAGLDSGVTTSSYHVGPNYEPSPERMEPRRTGYLARTVLRVRMTRLDEVGRVIDMGLAKGATGVEAVYFESSRVEDERRAALAEAAAAARRDAEVLARAMGGSLGRMISISTAGANDPRRINMMYGMEGAAMRTTAITPNEIVIAAAVVTRWLFNQAP